MYQGKHNPSIVHSHHVSHTTKLLRPLAPRGAGRGARGAGRGARGAGHVTGMHRTVENGR